MINMAQLRCAVLTPANKLDADRLLKQIEEALEHGCHNQEIEKFHDIPDSPSNEYQNLSDEEFIRICEEILAKPSTPMPQENSFNAHKEAEMNLGTSNQNDRHVPVHQQLNIEITSQTSISQVANNMLTVQHLHCNSSPGNQLPWSGSEPVQYLVQQQFQQTQEVPALASSQAKLFGSKEKSMEVLSHNHNDSKLALLESQNSDIRCLPGKEVRLSSTIIERQRSIKCSFKTSGYRLSKQMHHVKKVKKKYSHFNELNIPGNPSSRAILLGPKHVKSISRFKAKQGDNESIAQQIHNGKADGDSIGGTFTDFHIPASFCNPRKFAKEYFISSNSNLSHKMVDTQTEKINSKFKGQTKPTKQIKIIPDHKFQVSGHIMQNIAIQAQPGDIKVEEKSIIFHQSQLWTRHKSTKIRRVHEQSQKGEVDSKREFKTLESQTGREIEVEPKSQKLHKIYKNKNKHKL
jgi:hypothetical protein